MLSSASLIRYEMGAGAFRWWLGAAFFLSTPPAPRTPRRALGSFRPPSKIERSDAPAEWGLYILTKKIF